MDIKEEKVETVPDVVLSVTITSTGKVGFKLPENVKETVYLLKVLTIFVDSLLAKSIEPQSNRIQSPGMINSLKQNYKKIFK